MLRDAEEADVFDAPETLDRNRPQSRQLSPLRRQTSPRTIIAKSASIAVYQCPREALRRERRS